MPYSARLLATLAASTALALTGCSPDDPPEGADGGGGGGVCLGNADCGEKEICSGGECISNGCRSDADCTRPGSTCEMLSGTCTPGTGNDPDGGTVTDPDGGTVTTPDGGTHSGDCPNGTKYECPLDQICKAKKCVAPPASCATDNECPAGNICNFSRKCEPGCIEKRDCPDPAKPLCHPQKFLCEACSLTNPCPAGESCLAGACSVAKSCTNAGDCVTQGADGAVCVGGFCGNCAGHGDCAVDPYKADKRVCATDGLCRKVECTDANCKNTLGPRGYCDTAANECKTRECLSDADCPQSGTVCNTATYTCSGSAAGCDEATFNQCEAECNAQGLACNPATCACGGSGSGSGAEGDPCVASSDCATGYSCGLGICTEAAVDPITGGACDPFGCLLVGCQGAVTGRECDPFGCVFSLLGGGEVACL